MDSFPKLPPPRDGGGTEVPISTDEVITPFDGVILSGGGIRGIGELGVLHYYHEKGEFLPEKIKTYAATSIGSIISLLLICGYSPTDIFAKGYTLTNIIPIPSIVQIYDGIKNFGIMSIDPLMDIVKEMIVTKLPLGNPKPAGHSIKKIPTLLELYKLTGKTLVVSVGNVSQRRGEWFSWHNHPNLSVIDAVKMSCNLPIIFKRIKYNGDYYVDGGFTDNFPSECNELRECKKILGVAILSKSFFADESIFSYPYNILLMCVMHSLSQRLRIITSNDAITLIRINFGNTSILEFGASSEKKMDMFLKGYEEAKIEDSKEYLMVDGWGPPLKFDGWDIDF